MTAPVDVKVVVASNVSFVSVSPGVRSAWQSWAAWPPAATDPIAGTPGTYLVPLSVLRAQNPG